MLMGSAGGDSGRASSISVSTDTTVQKEPGSDAVIKPSGNCVRCEENYWHNSVGSCATTHAEVSNGDRAGTQLHGEL